MHINVDSLLGGSKCTTVSKYSQYDRRQDYAENEHKSSRFSRTKRIAVFIIKHDSWSSF
ncbi:hypothetical protein GLYMA_15G127450v4 [Glycine max]|nr:hypothetical protein GLYMA_15G127450v4 [Glycine max]KAH1146903.1 hypothetical protein GYH30_042185 [Glycine max]